MRKKIFEILDEYWFYLRWIVLDDFLYWARGKIKDLVTPLMWVGVAVVAIIAIPYFELKNYHERRKKKGGAKCLSGLIAVARNQKRIYLKIIL